MGAAYSWNDVGIEQVGARIDLHADVRSSAHTMWRYLPELLERRLTRAGLPPPA